MGEKEETGRRNGLFIKADRKKPEGFTKTKLRQEWQEQPVEVPPKAAELSVGRQRGAVK
ncbi:hypothetical protein [Prevotella fusca]